MSKDNVEMGQLIKSEDQFIFKFEGESSIDASVLANTISDIASLMKRTAKEIDSSVYLKMNVTAFKNGSFQIDFSAISEAINNLVTNPNAATIAPIAVAAFIGFFSIKKFLKGEKPKDIREDSDKAKIIKQNGDSVDVSKYSTSIFRDCEIDNLTINIAENASKSGKKGFTIGSSTTDTRVDFSEDDIKELLKPCVYEEDERLQKVSKTTAMLAIKKADFIGFSMWTFKMGGNYVDVSMQDNEWLSKVHNGDISISAGDSINATIETTIDLNDDGVPIEGSQRYAVVKVHGGIIHESVQTNMDL